MRNPLIQNAEDAKRIAKAMSLKYGNPLSRAACRSLVNNKPKVKKTKWIVNKTFEFDHQPTMFELACIDALDMNAMDRTLALASEDKCAFMDECAELDI